MGDEVVSPALVAGLVGGVEGKAREPGLQERYC
jgi:hypothetical protein